MVVTETVELAILRLVALTRAAPVDPVVTDPAPVNMVVYLVDEKLATPAPLLSGLVSPSTRPFVSYLFILIGLGWLLLLLAVVQLVLAFALELLMFPRMMVWMLSTLPVPVRSLALVDLTRVPYRALMLVLLGLGLELPLRMPGLDHSCTLIE